MSLQVQLKVHQWPRLGLLRYQAPADLRPLMQKFDVAEVGSGWGVSLGLVKEREFYGELIYQVNHNKYV